MESFNAKIRTLPGGLSLAAKSQADPDDKTLKQAFGKTDSESGLEGSAARIHENGVKAFYDPNEVVVEHGAVNEFVEVLDSVSGVQMNELEGSVAKTKENGVRVSGGPNELVVDHGSSFENQASVLGVNKHGEQSVDKTAAVGLIGDGLGNKAGSPANAEGSTWKLVVDLNKQLGYEDYEPSFSENGGNRDISMVEMNENREEGGKDVGDKELSYSVGDFVWGKIKSHPWWPGQIYDSSDASEIAAKYSRKNRFLVAYFGDGTFAWCHPSQLKPFEENFEQMSQQSNLKSFVNAVDWALHEFCRVVESGMTCSCVPKENLVGLSKPMAVNGGIKEGVFVPDGGIGKHSIAQFEPRMLLANLKNIAQVVSLDSDFELNVLKSKLLAFYRAKGGYQLPMYTPPQYILGLGDSAILGVNVCGSQGGIAIQGPSQEDWLSSPVTPGSQKLPLISGDKLYQRRKQKSVADILSEEMDVEPKNEGANTGNKGTDSGKLESTSRRGRKKKSSNEAENHAGNNFTSTSGKRQRMKLLGAFTSTQNVDGNVEIAGSGGGEENKKGPMLRERKANKISYAEHDGDSVEEETDNVSVQRERKKSKYLSPPYTSPIGGEKNLGSKTDSCMESPKASSGFGFQIGERISRVAGQLIGSPPIFKCSGEKDKKNLSSEVGIGHNSSGILISETPKQNQKLFIGPTVAEASAIQVLSEIRSAALIPPYAKDAESSDMIKDFLYTYRESIYREGSNYQIYNRRRPGRKRKSLVSEPVSSEKEQNETNQGSLQRKSPRIRSETTEAKLNKPEDKRDSGSSDMKIDSVPPGFSVEHRARWMRNEAKSDEPEVKQVTGASEAKSDKPEGKQVAGASDMNIGDKESEGKASSAAALCLSFGPGMSLPSKQDLIATYSKFGTVNTMETKVMYSTFCAQVVFVRSSDAEQAFNHSMSSIASGNSRISYRLRYLNAGSKKEIPSARASSVVPKESDKAPDNSSLQFIRQKLKAMTSMLEKSGEDMSQEMKINLESEMKVLLEKVSSLP